MPFTARVFGVLEAELRRQISFSFILVGNPRDPRSIQPLERLVIQVTTRNDSAIQGLDRAGRAGGRPGPDAGSPSRDIHRPGGHSGNPRRPVS